MGSIETDCVISESCYYEVTFYIDIYGKIINLGARHDCVILKTALLAHLSR